MKLSDADTVLDASCGTGLLAEELLNRYDDFSKLVLNDPSARMLEQAKYRMRYNKNVEFYNKFAEELTFADNSFSQIICLNSFHYYVNQPKVLGNFRRMLKPGGNLWILDWNRKGLFRIANLAISLLSPEHIKTRNLKEMKGLLGERGFNILEEDEWRYRWWRFLFVKCE